MRYLALILLLAAAPAVAGDLVFSRPGVTLRLTQQPCTDARVLVHIKPELHAQFKAGVGTLHGEEMPFCWMPNGSHVLVMIDDGSGGPLPLSAFKDPSV